MDFKIQQNVTDSINDELYRSIKNAVTKIAKKNGYIRYNTYMKILSGEGGNYLGVLYEVDIKGETTEGNEQETSIFVKQVLPNGDNINILSMVDIYSREIFVYTELATLFAKLQNEANVPEEKRFKLAKIYNESNMNAILLENMNKQGFKTHGRMETMDLNYAKLSMELLAKFHGLGFIIEIRMPDYFGRKIKSLSQPINIDADHKVFINKMYEVSTRKLSADQKIKIDNWWKIAVDDYNKYLQGTMTEIKGLSHGDFKMNNIMYKETEGEITEVIAVDYQITHYGSPILDLLFFLYLGTDRSFRKEHLNYLKEHYYLSLKKYLEYFDVPVDDVYPKKLFEKDFINCLDYAVISCFWILPFVMIQRGEAPDISDVKKIYNLEFNVDDRYYDRVKGVFDDYFLWDL